MATKTTKRTRTTKTKTTRRLRVGTRVRVKTQTEAGGFPGRIAVVRAINGPSEYPIGVQFVNEPYYDGNGHYGHNLDGLLTTESGRWFTKEDLTVLPRKTRKR